MSIVTIKKSIKIQSFHYVDLLERLGARPTILRKKTITKNYPRLILRMNFKKPETLPSDIMFARCVLSKKHLKTKFEMQVLNDKHIFMIFFI